MRGQWGENMPERGACCVLGAEGTCERIREGEREEEVGLTLLFSVL